MSSAPNHGHPITAPGGPRDPPDAAARRRRRDVTCPQAIRLAGRPVWGQVNGSQYKIYIAFKNIHSFLKVEKKL